ncbi:hypothetical protein PV08_05388 [Exophiala spinifera]|uniref:Uncharacterized protein n=1 Tax=Exophiala spinifera TaxID=91928 RepID=A0A0D1ZRB2_9EURO|nr:uncharacterized protein PV08_05388 [Exophiala spinifera]KIW15342.1 hypothetical protein PV08_05388 [Exophiala spinifera]
MVVPVPKLLPVTGTFAPAFVVYYVLLNLRVTVLRFSERTSLGDNSKTADGEGKTANTGPCNLLVACRAQSNFADNVPFALLAAAFAELNGANRRVLTGSLAALLFFRIIHVEFGLKNPNALGLGRKVGYLGTLGFLTGMSSYAAYLAKSYWGF